MPEHPAEDGLQHDDARRQTPERLSLDPIEASPPAPAPDPGQGYAAPVPGHEPQETWGASPAELMRTEPSGAGGPQAPSPDAAHVDPQAQPTCDSPYASQPFDPTQPQGAQPSFEPADPAAGAPSFDPAQSWSEPPAFEAAPPTFEQQAYDPTGQSYEQPVFDASEPDVHDPSPADGFEQPATDAAADVGDPSFDAVFDAPAAPEAESVPAEPHVALSPRHQLEEWLATMVQKQASDLILRAGGRPGIRIDGRIRFLPGRVPASGALLEVLDGVVGTDRMKLWRETGSVDVAIHLDGLGRFRLNAYRQMGDPALVLRRIAEDPPLLEGLGLPVPELKRLAGRKRGIVLVTGIAGSGKSTTLAAMIQYMNLHMERHVVTLEDPVEMLFSEDRCVISQREVGTDCPSFHEGLRHALRQSPDVILIGEMRDAETVVSALDATETGHLVLSTLHTVNAPQTVDRILSFFNPEQHVQVRARLAENLAGVLSQRLLPKSSGKGMVPAVELLLSTPHVRELLAEGRTLELSRVIETGAEAGLISFNQSLRGLVEQTIVDLEVALTASDRADDLMMGLRGFSHGKDRRQKEPGGTGGLRMSAKPPE